MSAAADHLMRSTSISCSGTLHKGLCLMKYVELEITTFKFQHPLPWWNFNFMI